MSETTALPLEIPLEGSSNLRDLGGWASADGRRVRPGLLFRSAALAGLTPSDQDTISRLGLRAICDFRGTEEAALAPTRLADVPIHHLPIEPTVSAALRDMLTGLGLAGLAGGADVAALLRGTYESFALDCTAQFRAFFARVLAAEGAPLLFHCAAGKDRTGFAAALLLSALDVPWPTVLRDYLATNTLWRRDTVPGDHLPASVREVLFSAQPWMLEASFAAIRRTRGSVDAYLERALGLSPADRDRLRALYLEA